MKTCPTCHTQYTDDTLVFCLQDGTPLGASIWEPSTESAREDEDITAVRTKYPVPNIVPVERKKTGSPRVSPARTSRSRTPILVAATATATVLILGMVGLGAWLYFGSGGDTGRDTSNARTNQNAPSTNTNSTRTPTPRPSPSPSTDTSVSPTPTPGTAADKEEASREIAEQIGEWESLSESGDLDAYMSKYAGTVDYYQRRGASVEFVRRDKQRAFGMYDSISFDISNVNVRVDDSGKQAVATFDKEWEFEGERRSTGKVRQQLELRKINGEWLITGERDLRVY